MHFTPTKRSIVGCLLCGSLRLGPFSRPSSAIASMNEQNVEPSPKYHLLMFSTPTLSACVLLFGILAVAYYGPDYTHSVSPSLQMADSAAPPTAAEANVAPTNPTSIYDFTVNDSKHRPHPMSQYRGKVILVMNVASQCGLTKSGYTTATEMYNKYHEQGLEVIAFPCNQFGGQEPGSEQQVEQMVCSRFSAKYPIMEKVDVNGDKANPMWTYMKNERPGIFWTTRIKWNFTMFLINRKGQVVERFNPGPYITTVEPKIVELLQDTA